MGQRWCPGQHWEPTSGVRSGGNNNGTGWRRSGAAMMTKNRFGGSGEVLSERERDGRGGTIGLGRKEKIKRKRKSMVSKLEYSTFVGSSHN
jgi:hypothetical protein